ncbi:MAG: isochorismatase family protein [Candidatus Aminicenantes bacterium]|nr:isochorismatase family protein [Candidatus Aminicenantes bacterium]
MKETYFTLDNIDIQAAEMLEAVKHLRKSAPMTLNPGKAALLVLDMQRYFLEETSHAFIPSAAAIIPRIQRLQSAFFNSRLPVVQTRNISSPQNAGLMNSWWKELIVETNPLSEITAGIRDEHAAVFVKTQYDAFYNTNLEQWLSERHISQVVIAGVMTHLCCETTARSAFMRGFQVFFTVDATASYNRQFHQASLLNLSHGFAVPILSEQVIAAVTAAATTAGNKESRYES